MQVQTLETRAFLALVVLVTAVFVWLLGGYLMPVFWAAVLAILFARPFVWVRQRLGGRDTPAALLTLLMILVLVVAPLVGLGVAVTSEAVGVYSGVASGATDLQEVLEQAEALLPRVTRLAEDWGVDLDGMRERVSSTAISASRAVASGVVNVGQQTAQFVLLLAVTLYLLFFFLRDGDRIMRTVIRALPLGDTREERLFSRFAAVTRATVKGSFIVAAVQGAIGGVAFWGLALGAPVLWGAIMAVCALIPAVGTALVWIPATIYLLAVGSWGKAIILVLVGVVVIGLVDNALRPILVGRDAGMPDYMILLTTLAGLATFGISGLVVGPIIGGLFMTVWDIFTEEFGPVDNDPQPGEAVRAVVTPGPGTGGPTQEAPPSPSRSASAHAEPEAFGTTPR